MELLVETSKYVFEELDAQLGTHEFIYVASNYQEIFGGGYPKGVKRMVYDILDKP